MCTKTRTRRHLRLHVAAATACSDFPVAKCWVSQAPEQGSQSALGLTLLSPAARPLPAPGASWLSFPVTNPGSHSGIAPPAWHSCLRPPCSMALRPPLAFVPVDAAPQGLGMCRPLSTSTKPLHCPKGPHGEVQTFICWTPILCPFRQTCLSNLLRQKTDREPTPALYRS